MFIRKESREDFDSINNLVKVAFETAQVSDGKEQDYVLMLRNSNNYIPELSFVAVEDEDIIGHIMLSKFYIISGNSRFKSLLLAPVSVDLRHRNKGVGSKLIEESSELALKLGYNSIILVGNPKYYNRFGFKSAIEFGITNSNGIPDEYVLARELTAGALQGVAGSVSFETL